MRRLKHAFFFTSEKKYINHFFCRTGFFLLLNTLQKKYWSRNTHVKRLVFYHFKSLLILRLANMDRGEVVLPLFKNQVTQKENIFLSYVGSKKKIKVLNLHFLNKIKIKFLQV